MKTNQTCCPVARQFLENVVGHILDGRADGRKLFVQPDDDIKGKEKEEKGTSIAAVITGEQTRIVPVN